MKTKQTNIETVEIMSPEIRKSVLKSLKQAKEGNFATEKEVNDLFKKYRLTDK